MSNDQTPARVYPQSTFAIVRAQAGSLAVLTEARHKKPVLVKADDVVVLIDTASDVEPLKSDEARRNYFLTTRERCVAKCKKLAEQQKRQREKAGKSELGFQQDVCERLSMSDYRLLVKSAEKALLANDHRLHHGVGSNVGGDGEGELAIEPIRDAETHRDPVMSKSADLNPSVAEAIDTERKARAEVGEKSSPAERKPEKKSSRSPGK